MSYDGSPVCLSLWASEERAQIQPQKQGHSKQSRTLPKTTRSSSFMAHKPCSKNRSDRPSSSSDVSESVGTVAGRAVILKYVGERVDGAIGHEQWKPHLMRQGLQLTLTRRVVPILHG